MRENALWRGNARRPNVFGNALGSFVVGQMSPKAAAPANPNAKVHERWAGYYADNSYGPDIRSDVATIEAAGRIAQKVEDAYAGDATVEVVLLGEKAWEPVDELGPEYQFENILARQRASRSGVTMAADGKPYEEPWVGGVPENYFDPIVGTPLPEQVVVQSAPVRRSYDYGGGYNYPIRASVASTNSNPADKYNKNIHDFADAWASRANYGALALGAVSKLPGTRILASAGALQEVSLRRVGAAEDLSAAVGIFKNPDGKTATALAESSVKYGKYIKGMGYAGTALGIVDEVRYINSISDNKKFHAWAASGINVLGNAAATTLGFIGGAFLGSAPTPAVFMTIPAGAALGAGLLSTGYDAAVAPMIRDAFGVPDPLRK